jgi:hypothetical protein
LEGTLYARISLLEKKRGGLLHLLPESGKGSYASFFVCKIPRRHKRVLRASFGEIGTKSKERMKIVYETKKEGTKLFFSPELVLTNCLFA